MPLPTPDVTLTGNIRSIFNSEPTGREQIIVTLVNYGRNIPTVSSSLVLVDIVQTITPSPVDGSFSQTFFSNLVISPGPNITYYVFDFVNGDGEIALTVPFQFTAAGSFNLAALIPFGGPFLQPPFGNAIISNPNALQTITNFQLNLPSLGVKGPSTFYTNVVSNATATRTFTLPDANSNPVQPATAGTHQFATAISSTGAITFAQPSYSDLTGTPQLPITKTAVTSNWIRSYDSTTGLFTASQPAYSDITGTPQSPITKSAVASNWLRSYDSTTGLFTASQPAFTDIPGTASTSQIPSLDASKITTGQIALARGGTGSDLSATGGTSQVLKQVSVGGVITVGQLAFTDLTGTATGAQLPVPGAASKGGVFSKAVVTHNFLTSISSVDGSIGQAQPAAADLSDTATSGNVLRGNGTSFVSAALAAADLSNGVTGTGAVVLANTPTLITPVLGVATATTINKVTLTAPATGSTLTIANGKTLTLSNTLTFAGTDSTILTFQATGTVVNRDSTDTLTHKTIDTAGTGNSLLIGGAAIPATKGTANQVLAMDGTATNLTFATVSGGTQSTSLQFGMVAVPLLNPTYPKAYGINLTSGDNDLYTVPANRNAIVMDVTFTNPTGSGNSITCLAEAKLSGVYHTFDFICAGATQGTYGSTNSLAAFLLKPGEIFAVNTDHNGLTVWPYIVEFDTTTNISDARLLSLSSGDNTLFTVPANTTVSFVGLNVVAGNNIGRVWYWNNSGGIRAAQISVVPSGGSASVNNAIFKANVATKQMAQALIYGCIGAGDFINITTDAATATQTAWVVYTSQ